MNDVWETLHEAEYDVESENNKDIIEIEVLDDDVFVLHCTEASIISKGGYVQFTLTRDELKNMYNKLTEFLKKVGVIGGEK